MINNYLDYIQEKMDILKPKYLYHCCNIKTPTMKPRLTALTGVNLKKSQMLNAIFAATDKDYVLAFGLERINMMTPNTMTEKQARSLKRVCWLVAKHPNLQVWYWNYTPTKPLYRYTFTPEGFTPHLVYNERGQKGYHWTNPNELNPLKIETFRPNQVKQAWHQATDAEWEDKIRRYKKKGLFK